MVIDTLREATKQVHKELDEWLLPEFNNVNSKEKYAVILKAFYSYFKPLMDKIGPFMDSIILPDYADRRKPEAILDDLAALHLPVDGIIAETKLPLVDNAAQAFGALYVLEGSTLGGVYLSKILAQNLQLDADKGLSFFYGYGKASKAHWTNFIDHLNSFAQKTNTDAEIVHSAIETFRCFKEHLQNTTNF